eukprot:m.60758 g.60758  ORF g.60758 m.60758 type:complete len:117 (-) comp13681_c1_seq3:382-732(-)
MLNNNTNTRTTIHNKPTRLPHTPFSFFSLQLRYFSFLRYTFCLAMQLQFTNYNFTITCNSSNDFCPKDGEAVLEFYNVNELTWYANLMASLGFVIGLRLLAYYFVRRSASRFDHSI